MEFIYSGNSLKAGIYKITNKTNGRIYIGSAKLFKVRWYQHSHSLSVGKHANSFLQADFNKCGTDAFIFEVLDVIDGTKEHRLIKEDRYLKQYYDGCKNCYNMRSDARSGDGACLKNPELTWQRKSEASKRISKIPEVIKARSERMKKYWENKELCKKRSEDMKERWSTDGYRDNISEKVSDGVKKQWQKLTAEERAIISEKSAVKQRGRKHEIPHSSEQIEKMRIAAHKRQERKLQQEADMLNISIDEYKSLPEIIARIEKNNRHVKRQRELKNGAPRMRKPKQKRGNK